MSVILDEHFLLFQAKYNAACLEREDTREQNSKMQTEICDLKENLDSVVASNKIEVRFNTYFAWGSSCSDWFVDGRQMNQASIYTMFVSALRSKCYRRSWLMLPKRLRDLQRYSMSRTASSKRLKNKQPRRTSWYRICSGRWSCFCQINTDKTNNRHGLVSKNLRIAFIIQKTS